uniref:Uncharacterized protein n=1 Tax=Rhizophora mucronata TaxID=61149 RepID=A0A2P2PZY6_RHIMU
MISTISFALHEVSSKFLHFYHTSHIWNCFMLAFICS